MDTQPTVMITQAPPAVREDAAVTPRQPLSSGGQWTFDLIAEYDTAIREIAVGEFGLDCYPNQIEIIASEQMLDAYASVGLPIRIGVSARSSSATSTIIARARAAWPTRS